MEADDDGSFARLEGLWDEDVGADGVVVDCFVGGLEDFEALEVGGRHFDGDVVSGDAVMCSEMVLQG